MIVNASIVTLSSKTTHGSGIDKWRGALTAYNFSRHDETSVSNCPLTAPLCPMYLNISLCGIVIIYFDLQNVGQIVYYLFRNVRFVHCVNMNPTHVISN